MANAGPNTNGSQFFVTTGFFISTFFFHSYYCFPLFQKELTSCNCYSCDWLAWWKACCLWTGLLYKFFFRGILKVKSLHTPYFWLYLCYFKGFWWRKHGSCKRNRSPRKLFRTYSVSVCLQILLWYKFIFVYFPFFFKI